MHTTHQSRRILARILATLATLVAAVTLTLSAATPANATVPPGPGGSMCHGSSTLNKTSGYVYAKFTVSCDRVTSSIRVSGMLQRKSTNSLNHTTNTCSNTTSCSVIVARMADIAGSQAYWAAFDTSYTHATIVGIIKGTSSTVTCPTSMSCVNQYLYL